MAINLDIDIGDVVLAGKFKNKRTIVKKIGRDSELNQPTINDKPMMNMRIEKDMPKDKQSRITKEKEEMKKKLTTEQLKKLIAEQIEQSEQSYMVEIEAQVYGGSSAGADMQYVTVSIPRDLAKKLPFSKLEDMCVEQFYEEGGFGPDPYCESLSIDGIPVDESTDLDSMNEEDEMMKAAMEKAKGKVNPKAVMASIGNNLVMSPEERKEKNSKGLGAKMGIAEIKKIIREEIKGIMSEQILPPAEDDEMMKVAATVMMMKNSKDLNALFDKVSNSIIKHGKRIKIKLNNGDYLDDEAWRSNNSVYRKNENDGCEHILNKRLGLTAERVNGTQVKINYGTPELLKNLAYNPFQ